MHLAAESHVDRSIDGPGTFIETNVTGTYTLLEAARAYWTSAGKPEGFRFHHISTDEVYGTLGATGLFTEDTPYAPNSPYSASKAASDHLVRAWARDLRPAGRPDELFQQLRALPLPRKADPRGDPERARRQADPGLRPGENVRDWLYVEDHADALLLVLRKGRAGPQLQHRRQQRAAEHRPRAHDLRAPRRAPPGCRAHDRLITFVTDRPGATTCAMPSTPPASAMNWAGSPRSRWRRGWRAPSTGISKTRTGGARCRRATGVGERLGKAG
jgi:dTDP-glucose 4,6-dehydratase